MPAEKSLRKFLNKIQAFKKKKKPTNHPTRHGKRTLGISVPRRFSGLTCKDRTCLRDSRPQTRLSPGFKNQELRKPDLGLGF